MMAVLLLAGAQVSAAAPFAGRKTELEWHWQAMNTANWDLEEHGARQGLVVTLGAIGAEPGGPGVVEGGEIHTRRREEKEG
jgi:hypothetical protein